MGLETEGNEFNSWQEEQNRNAQDQGSTGGGILDRLFRVNSLVADNRGMKIVDDVYKVLTEGIYKNIQTSTTDAHQRQIIPTVEHLTSAISSSLPGLGFYVVLDGTLYIMGMLFSNRENSFATEHIDVNQGTAQQQRVSIPVTPAAQINAPFIAKLKEHYDRVKQSVGATSIEVINLFVQDMEMLNHPEAGDQKDWAHNIAMYAARQWEESLLVTGANMIVAAGREIPAPWLEPATPYGKDNTAEARVQAVSGRVTHAKTLSPANMEVVVATVNNRNNNGNYNPNNDSSREIARITASVSLTGVTWEEYQAQQFALSQSADYMTNLRSWFGNSMTNSIYQGSYRPLRPEITLENVTAGEMMHNNGGLYPIFFGLYTLMTTNQQYVWADALRKLHVGGRGSMAGLETRIQMVIAGMPNAGAILNPQMRPPLNEKNINDTDFVTSWVHQNVSPHATFKYNLVDSGVDSPIVRFMRRLLDPVNNQDAVKVVVALIDSMSKKRFSKIIQENITAGRGWNPSKPILIRTNTIVVNGLAVSQVSKDDKERHINTLEVDEMYICNAKPGATAASKAGIENFMGIVYGSQANQNVKQRSQLLRVEHGSSLFDGRNHINAFGTAVVWAPDFMAALGTAMDGVGQLNSANNLGSFRVNKLAFAPGGGLATTHTAGSNNAMGGGVQLMNFFNPQY